MKCEAIRNLRKIPFRFRFQIRMTNLREYVCVKPMRVPSSVWLHSTHFTCMCYMCAHARARTRALQFFYRLCICHRISLTNVIRVRTQEPRIELKAKMNAALHLKKAIRHRERNKYAKLNIE